MPTTKKAKEKKSEPKEARPPRGRNQKLPGMASEAEDVLRPFAERVQDAQDNRLSWADKETIARADLALKMKELGVEGIRIDQMDVSLEATEKAYVRRVKKQKEE